MNIAVLKDWNTTYEEFAEHWDGIMAAFWEIAKRHPLLFVTKIDGHEGMLTFRNVSVYSNHENKKITPLVEQEEFDAVICWGSLDRPWHQYLDEYLCPKILCFAGGPTEHPNLKHFDVICVESKIYEDKFRAQGKKAIRAFGTNTSVFRYEGRTPKVIDALYPASFCFHKNHELFARAMQNCGLAVGNYNEQSIVGRVLQIGTPTLPRVSSETLRDLYNMSHCVVLPGGPDSGSQRVVLEAFACGTPVVVMSDNDKCREFVEESGFGRVVEPIDREIRDTVEELMMQRLDPMLGINYVKSKWTEHHYASSILEAISIAKS